ncbi:hypothetical protein EK0264_03580 [Epidermidibacterium keratini]|uniref:Uncharacterized protein n=1 Tax=Epidermidibacterium keratini TaxID=1891644 RepID=A0A7L4YJI6_9ACTN|nr:hypothetical protein [Epidermidibacterium keratini]QHB99450.1 hypothetical protein EK0264_03580 [Epidermidibacterium keratini]
MSDDLYVERAFWRHARKGRMSPERRAYVERKIAEAQAAIDAYERSVSEHASPSIQRTYQKEQS